MLSAAGDTAPNPTRRPGLAGVQPAEASQGGPRAPRGLTRPLQREPSSVPPEKDGAIPRGGHRKQKEKSGGKSPEGSSQDSGRQRASFQYRTVQDQKDMPGCPLLQTDLGAGSVFVRACVYVFCWEKRRRGLSRQG